MKDYKTMSLSIVKPLEESSLLMVLGGTSDGFIDEEKSDSNCKVLKIYEDKCDKCDKCSKCNKCGLICI